MPDYGSYCPISMATDVLADRWTPLICRELILGNTRFNDIARGLPGISRSLLTQRLRHLERKGVIETWPSPTGRGSEYHLTPAGKDLYPVLEGMAHWAIEWLYDDIHPDDVDSLTLMWWMHRRVDPDQLPPNRVIVQFDHTAPERQSYWLVFDHREASVCLQHPGSDPDVLVTTTTPVLGEVFSGTRTWSHAVRQGDIEVAGSPKLARAVPSWFLWSPFREVTAARAARAARGATRPA